MTIGLMRAREHANTRTRARMHTYNIIGYSINECLHARSAAPDAHSPSESQTRMNAHARTLAHAHPRALPRHARSHVSHLNSAGTPGIHPLSLTRASSPTHTHTCEISTCRLAYARTYTHQRLCAPPHAPTTHLHTKARTRVCAYNTYQHMLLCANACQPAPPKCVVCTFECPHYCA